MLALFVYITVIGVSGSEELRQQGECEPGVAPDLQLGPASVRRVSQHGEKPRQRAAGSGQHSAVYSRRTESITHLSVPPPSKPTLSRYCLSPGSVLDSTGRYSPSCIVQSSSAGSGTAVTSTLHHQSSSAQLEVNWYLYTRARIYLKKRCLSVRAQLLT